MRRAFCCTILGILLAVAAGAQSELPVRMVEMEGEARKYWPRWRGPSGQGLVEGTGYPDTWSDTQNVIWKVEVPVRGNSSPIIWGDRIFLTTARESGVWPVNSQKRSILCLRRQDGKLLWETFAPDGPAERVHSKNGLASATPATDGERVYAYLGNQGLVAVDFNGKIVWHRGLGEEANYHGVAGSPLLYKDKVILFQDQGRPAQSFVAAFDTRTGKTAWWTNRQESVGWGTPVAIRAGDRDEIIVSSSQRVYAYQPDTGKELWRADGNLFEVIPTPVAGLGLIFASSGRAGPTLAIRPGGSGDVTRTHLAWETPRGSPFIPSTLLHGDYLYMVNDMTSIATCLQARTGKPVWQGRLGEAHRESFSASPVAVEGKIYFTNDEGETFVLKAGPEFQVLRVNRLNARTLASPALADGRWYFRTDRHLLAIGSR